MVWTNMMKAEREAYAAKTEEADGMLDIETAIAGSGNF